MYGNVPPGRAKKERGKGGSDLLTIIEVKAREDGGHGLQSQSHRKECWLEGWVAVPEELAAAVWACGGYCDLELSDQGELTGVTPKQRPQAEEQPPSESEQLRADVDYLAAVAGVSL